MTSRCIVNINIIKKNVMQKKKKSIFTLIKNIQMD